MDLHAEYQMAGETQTDTSKLIQEIKRSLERLYCEAYIQPEIVGGCAQLRVAHE